MMLKSFPKDSRNALKALCLSIMAVAISGLLPLARGSENDRLGNVERLAPVLHETASLQVPAPDLNIGTDWLNTKKPLSIADLQGRIVLLDFWTLC